MAVMGRWRMAIEFRLMIAGAVLVVLKATKAPAISRLLVINEKRDVAFMAQVLKV